MITLYGKILRKIRIDHDELLKDMASKLNITSAYLSSIENGKRAIPINMTNNIAKLYCLNSEMLGMLEKAEDDSRTKIEFDFSTTSNNKKNTVLALARQFDDISDEQLEQIRNILRKKDM